MVKSSSSDKMRKIVLAAVKSAVTDNNNIGDFETIESAKCIVCKEIDLMVSSIVTANDPNMIYENLLAAYGVKDEDINSDE